MEALKSYFSKFRKHRSVSGDRGISPTRRKRNKFRKRSLNDSHSDDDDKNGSITVDPLRNNDPFSHKSNVSAVRSIYEKPLLMDVLSNCSKQKNSHREKSPPPAKPPRKDQVFTVTFQNFLPRELGIVLGVTQDYRVRCRLRSEGSAESTPICDKNSVIRVLFIKDGSAAAASGQVRVDDEVISVNGWNMARENTSSARLLLANAVRSGKVTMTLRRKKKRPAPPPPTNQGTPGKSTEDHEKENKSIMTQSLDSLPGNSGSHDNWYLGSRDNGSSLTLDSMGSYGIDMGSTDDVFMENSSEHSRVLQHQAFSESAISMSSSQISKSDYVNVSIGNSRTHSASIIDDVVEWNTDPINLTQDVMETVNTAQMTLKNRGKASSLKSSMEQDLSMYSSDPELISINTSKHLYKKNKKGWRYHQDRGGTQTPTSCYSSDSGGSSHVPKKRVVAKMHLLKDENGLGIHIAGGRGSKKGDIGIFVAGITEGGAAFRDGRLKRSDELLMINGKSLIGLSHSEAVDVLRNSPKLVQLVVASKVRNSSSVTSTGSSSVPSLCSIPSSQQHPTEAMTSDLPVPEVTAQTPSGTVFNWEDLMEKFALPLDHSDRTSKSKDQMNDLTQMVTVHKGAQGKGLGFTIVGGSDSEKGNLGIYVRRILPHGLIAEEGSIKEGDEILKVNDQPIKGLTHKEAIHKFRSLRKGPVSITFTRRSRSRASSPSLRSGRITPVEFSSEGSPVSTPGHSPSPSFDDLATFCDEILGTHKRFSDISNYDNRLSDSLEERAPSEVSNRLSSNSDFSHSGKDNSLQEILLQKESGIGLGISLIRKDCKGMSQIFIQDVYTGSTADKDGRLRKSDQIIEVNGKPLQGLSLLDAYQSFRSLKAGPIVLVIKRGENFLTISVDQDNTFFDSLNRSSTQNASAELRPRNNPVDEPASITGMTDQGEKVKAASLPIEIQRKSKMEGSTTDSDFSDLDIQTFEKKPSTSPPPTRSNSSPYGSPHKRGYPPNVDNFSVDKFNSEQSPKKRNLNQYPFGPGKENLFNLNWTNLLSSRDSAIGGSLMSTLGSALTDTSSSYETNSESELSSSGHSVYGRYQKIDGSSGDSSEEEVLVLHRLPGENLGMILGIDSDPAHQTVRSVYVKTVTIGGAAYRATGSKKGIQEGDQILQINGTDLNILTHDECLTVLREMPLRVILKIRRGKKKVKTAVKLSPPLSLGSRGSFGDSPSPLIYSESSSYSESEEDDGKLEGFAQIHVEIDKHPNESLGLSVVPSYGSTRQYYQIKRLLPSGAAARSQQIRVGDRLVSCNGINLRNVSQSKCLSVLKSEGNSGDLELELLRPKENEEQLEISLKVSHKDSPLTLHSPSQQRKNFIADIPESDSDNEVVLNKFQYIDNTGVDGDLRPHNLKPNIPSEKLDNSDADQTKRNIKLKSTNSKMDEGGDSWNYAVPPPMEFSTYGPAVPPPAEFSEGQSPIFNQSNNGIPVTNIDEIIKSYRPIVQSNDNYIPQADTDDTGFHAHENGSLNNSLTDFDDNLPGEEGLNVMDGFQGINNMNLEEDQGKNVEDNDNDVEPFIPPAPVNTEDLDFDTKHSNEDDDFIVPVKVQRQKHIPFESTVNVSSTGSSEIEEEHIVPSIEERRRIQPSATIKLEEKKYEELQPKPVPQPRVKPTIINVQHSPVPSSSATPEGPAVEEEIVSMEFKERQAGNESFLKKLGGEVEEEIVPVHVKRDQVKNVAKLAVITNMWSKSNSKSKDTASENNAEKKNLKSVISVLNSAPKQENSNKANDDKIDETKVVREEEKPEAKEQGIHKNVIKVEAPVSLDAENVNAIPEYVDTKSKNVDKKPDILDDKSPKLGSSSSEEIKVTDTTLPPQTVTVNSTKVQVKTNEKENVSSTLATDSKDVPPSSSVASKATEESVSSSKPAEVSPPSPFKSSIGITKPTSLLSTIRSQNPSSATLKPLSSIKPIAVTSKTFSMGRPGGLSTSLSTGRHSLLSTIHGTSTSTKSTRSEEEPFLVSVLKGILGVGMKVSTTPEGFVKVDEIQSSGPIAKDGNIRVGDYLLSINNTELTGLPDSKIQQILRLLPRGIAKILVSVKPPPSDGAARPTNLSFGSSESTQSKHSPLSSPRTMSKTSSMSPAMSPRQPVASPLTPSSPKQPSTPTSKTPGEEPAVTVTINHDQHSPETKKTPPPVAPKPKHSMVPEQSKPGSHWGGGGYVSSAVGRSHSFGKKEPQTVESKPHIQPRKADYVSSARKTVHDKEEKEPIDTVVFASVDFNKMNANSRHSIGKPKEKNVPEPKMIPKGHVDYVSSACPAVPSTKTTSPKSKDISYSPYAYEEVSTKISPVSLNSALSPRRKSEDKFSFGATHPGNRTKGKEGDQHDNVSPLPSPKSPVTTSQHSPDITPASLEVEVEVKVSPEEVRPKPVPRPRGSTSEQSLQDSEKDSTETSTSPFVVNTDQASDSSSVQPNSTITEDTVLVDVTDKAQSTDVDIVHSTEALNKINVALTDSFTQNDMQTNVDDSNSNVDEDDKPESLALDDTDSELFSKFVEEIVKNAIQKGIDAFKTSEAEDIVVDNEEGKMVDEISAEHDKHPTVVMETKSLRAFLQKLDSSEKEASTPDLYSQNQNVVAENIAKDMLKTLEDGADNASFTYTTKTSANTSNDLLTNTNNGEQVVECMSVSLDASVACNDVVLDSPNPDSMAVDEVNVNSVASEGNNVNALLIQEPKSCTEQPSEDMDIVSECVNSEAVIGDSQEDLENIEIILNENSVDTCDSMPIDFLGGGISQNKLTSMDNCTTQSRRLWVFCAGEQQFSSDAVNISAINAALRAVAPLDLETLINQANEDLDSYGYGLDARLVIVAMNSSSLREGLGVRLSSVENGPLIVSGVMEGSLAEREGHIQLGDKFVSVDGVSASSLSPDAVMNEMEDSSSGHVIVLTRLEENTEAPPPTPLAPPPTLPVSAPPDVPSEEPGTNVVEDEVCNDFDGVVTDNENVELKVERPTENVDSDIKASEADFTVNGPENSVNSNELEKHESNLTPDSISVTIPDLAEVSSPQGSQDSGVDTQDSGVDTQDSGVDSPSPLGTLTSTEDSDAKERPKVDIEEKQPLSNGDRNQVSLPISPLDSLGLLSTALSDDTDDDNAEKETFEVIMNKGVTGLGFLIEGGKASAKGDQPLTIKRIFKGGPAEKCGMLKVKDEILTVNNQDVTEMRHSEAWTHLKFLDEGPVHLLIRRKVQKSNE